MKLISATITPYGNLAVIRSTTNIWGWLPALTLTSAVGVFLVALAYNAARFALWWAEPLFWLGLLVIYLPVAVRLFSPKPTRQERISLLIVLGISFYFIKYLQYPIYFTYYDEFSHWRNASNIASSGHLFHLNPLNPITSYYPGLEIVTTLLSNVSGISIYVSGILVIGVIRVMFVLALYLFYERAIGSEQVAGIAMVIYMINPGALFTDTQFAYESLALPLAVFILFAVASRLYMPGRRKSLVLAIILAVAAVVVTHHVTSYALVVFLFLWTVIWALTIPRHGQSQKVQMELGRVALLGGVALLGLLLCVAWLVYTGGLAIGYLASHIEPAVTQLGQIFVGQTKIKPLFHDGSGFVAPLWERIATYASVVLIVLGLPFGLFRIWRHHRSNATILALAFGAIAYPATQALRLTPAGGETADRSTEFLFLGIALVLAIAITEIWLSRGPSWKRSTILMAALVVVFLGQTIVGNGPSWARLPGPYLVSADPRSIEPEGIAAAKWSFSYLGPGHRVATDRINTLLMATYGNELAETAGSASLSVGQVFVALHFGPTVKEILQQDGIQYLVVDHRLSTSLPRVGTYFNKPVTGQFHYTKPIDPAALAKFDNVQNVSRIFDSGNIVIYDIESFSAGTASASAPKASCNLASSPAVLSSYPKVATLYTGTIYDIPTGQAITMSLTGIKQEQGAICGFFSDMVVNAISQGMPSNGPFQGSITTARLIHFIVTSNARKITFSFDGSIQQDNSIAGTYCSGATGTGACSDYGLWSISPSG